MSTIVITGGTGLTGKAITHELLKMGYQVIVLTRKLPETKVQNNLRYALWDIKKQIIDISAIGEADYIIHLAGAGVVEKKWTAAYKAEILNSRTQSSRLLVDTLKHNANKVKALISASAIGWYGADAIDGNTRPGGFTETDSPDTNFLGETCRLWEESINPVINLGKRLVKYRLGIVLSNEGGALAEFKKPLRFRIAAILGNGKQIVSWVHIDDLVKMFITAIENETLNGVYNAVAPDPVTNKKLTVSLATAMWNRFFIPLHVPVFILKLIMGQRSIEVLKSTRVSCQKLLGTGFTFTYPNIEKAVAALISG